jgi:hypothetical protein
MATSLRTLRREVGRILNDVTVLTATQTGLDTKIYDNRNLAAGDDIWRGTDLYFVAGTADNIGETRRSTASDRSERSITWGVSLPAATATGDVCEVWNKRSKGWHPFEVNAAINSVITIKADQTLNVPTSAVAAAVFDRDSPLVTIPTTLNRIFAVEYEDDDGLWHPIPRARNIGDYGYYVNRGFGTVAINGANLLYLADAHTIRFRGYGTLTELTEDTDETELHAEWITLEAVATLLWQGIDRDRERERLYGAMAARADALRPFAIRRPDPNHEVVR